MHKACLQSQVAEQARTLDQDALQRLTELLCCGNQSVAEVAARIIARCCHDGATVSSCLAFLTDIPGRHAEWSGETGWPAQGTSQMTSQRCAYKSLHHTCRGSASSVVEA